jgi:uroporphyrinogen-III decarboxylase
LRKRGLSSRTGNRIDDLFNYRIPDRVPLGSMSIGFNAVNAGYRVREVLENPEKCFEAAVWTADLYDWDPMPQYSGHTVWGAIDFGGTVRMPVGRYESALINLPHFVHADPWSHPSILSFGHEVPIETAVKHFPNDIIFGNLDPTLLQMETPRSIYEMSCDIITRGKKSPCGFIMAPGCGIPATAPPVNVFAMTKAVYDVGYYS